MALLNSAKQHWRKWLGTEGIKNNVPFQVESKSNTVLVHLPGDRMVADMFTKPLPGSVLSGHLKPITRVVQDPTMAVEESTAAAEEEEARFRDEEDAQIDRAVQGKIKAIHSAGDWRKMRSLKLKRQKIVQKATVRSKAPVAS